MKTGMYYCAFSKPISIDSQKKTCDMLMAYFFIPFFLSTVKLKLTVKPCDLIELKSSDFIDCFV